MPDFSNFLEIQMKTAWGRTLSEFAAFCDPRPGSLIVDIGCGPGLLPAIFSQAGKRAFGADLDYELLASSQTRQLVQADGMEVPLRDSQFDLVCATNVLFLLEEPPAALREWARLLAPGGQMCLLNPSENLSVAAATEVAEARGLEGTARESLLGWANNAETHLRWTEAEMRELFASAGLEMIQSEVRVGPGFARFTRARAI